MDRIVECCFSIHVNSKSPINQATAKASLTQITNIVFQKVNMSIISRRDSDFIDSAMSPIHPSHTMKKNASDSDVIMQIKENNQATQSVASSNEEEELRKSDQIDVKPQPCLLEEETVNRFHISSIILKVQMNASSDSQTVETSFNSLKQSESFKLARKDAVQTFRFLCRVSMQTDNPSKNSSVGVEGSLTDALASLPVDEINSQTLSARILVFIAL